MTTIEMNARKAELIRRILNDMNSESAMVELENTIRRLAFEQSPCRYTPEELRASALEALRQHKMGHHTSHEEMKRMFDRVVRYPV